MDNMNKENRRFLFHTSWNEVLNLVKEEDPKLALDLLEAIIKYGTTGELETLPNRMAQGILLVIAHEIDTDFERALQMNRLVEGKKNDKRR